MVQIFISSDTKVFKQMRRAKKCWDAFFLLFHGQGHFSVFFISTCFAIFSGFVGCFGGLGQTNRIFGQSTQLVFLVFCHRGMPP